MSRVGKWTLDVSTPHPAWVTLVYEDQEITLIHHQDLRDLEYAVKRAINEARDKLPDSHKHEMD